jgi:hypothetical protein
MSSEPKFLDRKDSETLRQPIWHPNVTSKTWANHVIKEAQKPSLEIGADRHAEALDVLTSAAV